MLHEKGWREKGFAKVAAARNKNQRHPGLDPGSILPLANIIDARVKVDPGSSPG